MVPVYLLVKVTRQETVKGPFQV